MGLDTSLGTSTDPVSVEWRLTSYRERSDAAPPPTLCRWGDDCQAIASDRTPHLHRPCVGGVTIAKLSRRHQEQRCVSGV